MVSGERGGNHKGSGYVLTLVRGLRRGEGGLVMNARTSSVNMLGGGCVGGRGAL